MTTDALLDDIWTMIEEAQREANQAENPALRRLLLKRRDMLSEIRQRVRELERATPPPSQTSAPA